MCGLRSVWSGRVRCGAVLFKNGLGGRASQNRVAISQQDQSPSASASLRHIYTLDSHALSHVAHFRTLVTLTDTDLRPQSTVLPHRPQSFAQLKVVVVHAASRSSEVDHNRRTTDRRSPYHLPVLAAEDRLLAASAGVNGRVAEWATLVVRTCIGAPLGQRARLRPLGWHPAEGARLGSAEEVVVDLDRALRTHPCFAVITYALDITALCPRIAG